jgi:hypothetical protein
MIEHLCLLCTKNIMTTVFAHASEGAISPHAAGKGATDDQTDRLTTAPYDFLTINTCPEVAPPICAMTCEDQSLTMRRDALDDLGRDTRALTQFRNTTLIDNKVVNRERLRARIGARTLASCKIRYQRHADHPY